MTRYFVSVLCALMIVGAAQFGHTRDADGAYFVRGSISCGKYLGAYSRAMLAYDSDSYKGPLEFSNAAGWIDGYISSYNHWTAKATNDKVSVAAGLSHNDVYRWVASWCRDNPSKDLVEATYAFIVSRG